MGVEVHKNLQQARFLMKQFTATGIRHGCFEVSLVAMGARVSFVDVLDSTLTKFSGMKEIIARYGLQMQWIVEVTNDKSIKDWRWLLEGHADYFWSTPTGKLVGHLVVFYYADDEANSVASPRHHVMTIIPRQDMKRDLRRKVKKQVSYIVVDTKHPAGVIQVSLDNLRSYTNEEIKEGATALIIKLRRVK